MEVDCKNEAIVKCIEEDGRVGVDIDSFSTEDRGQRHKNILSSNYDSLHR